ncbi:hypothetical protein RN001_004122 [Aquatica leii]|uniref:Odorant receptor n=1 Tax=Aquatica leii TaxID=1421715 RepID=A0AAN7SEH9_9COLE|nr:hypothetical protein RN001_004122 [Aquatica leii]
MIDLDKQLRRNCHVLPRFALRCLGISVNENENKLYKMYSWIMIITGSLFPWTSLHLISRNLSNYDIIISGLFNFVGGFAAFLKIIVIKYNNKSLKNIFDDLEHIQEERNKDRWGVNDVYKVNKLMLIAIVIFFTTLFSFYAGTLIVRIVVKDPTKWILPISDFSLFNTSYSPNFEIAWLYHSIGPTMTASGFCITDFLIAALIIDITTQYKVLRITIKERFKVIQDLKDNSSISEETKYQFLRQMVKDTVTHHLTLISLTNNIKTMCSSLLLITVISSISIMTFSLYYASVLPMLSTAALLSYFEISAIASTLFLVSYFGTQLAIASENIAHTFYEMDFVGLDVRFQKSLLLIIMRGQKPSWLTIGGFTNLSIGVFAWVIRTTYSYLMILRKNSTVKENKMY